MGAGLAKAALAASVDLPHAPRLLLVAMSLQAMDADPAPTCFAGRDVLVDAMGLPRSDFGYRALRKHIVRLREAGWISVTAHAAPGRAARYALHVTNGGPSGSSVKGSRGIALDPRTEEQERPLMPINGGTSGANGGTSSTRTEVQPVPREEEEENREEDPPSPHCTTHPNGTSEPCRKCGEARRKAESWRPPRRPRPVHVHRYEPSGYCGGCGIRSDAL